MHGNKIYKFTWNKIIAALTPHMIDECSEKVLKFSLHEFVKQEKNNIPSFSSISDESFQTIKVQLIALGIIKPSAKKHSSTDTNTYWTLTQYGNRIMMKLKAIKR